MGPNVEPLLGLGLWHWFALAAALVTLEIAIPSTYLLWPGIAAAVVGVVLAFAPEVGWQVQVVLFAVLAVVASVAGRAYFTSQGGIATDRPTLNLRALQFVGQQAFVAEDFHAGRGPVTLQDSRWEAETVDHSSPKRGEIVEVVGADGVTLKVRVIAAT